MPRDIFDRIIHGAIAGMNGAATMTVLRMLAHRAGLVDEMVPQKVEHWARRLLGVGEAPVPALHRVLDTALHLAYGATWGGLYGAVLGGRRRSHALPALGFGAGLWGFGMLALFPALGIGRPAWRSRPRENAVNLAVHFVYAEVTGFLVDEFARQSRVNVTGRLGRLPPVG
jgi:hypothetical protein